jgi:hypothetical protein
MKYNKGTFFFENGGSSTFISNSLLGALGFNFTKTKFFLKDLISKAYEADLSNFAFL